MCYQSRMGGLAEGSWFLPSALELITLYSTREVVNTTLQTIGGAVTIPNNDYYWSSTEHTAAEAFYLYLQNGSMYMFGNKHTTFNNIARCAVAY